MPKSKKLVTRKSQFEKKQSTAQSKRPDLTYIIVTLFAIIVLVCLGLLAYSARSNQTTYSPASEKLSIKKMPPDIKQQVLAASPSATFRVPVLMYHYVEFVRDKRDTIRQSLDIIPPVFDSQIATLKNAGYTFMTASDLADVLDGMKPLPEKPVLITFDDGHRDFYTDAFQILQKYNVKATEFVITGFLGGSDFMTPEQVTTIAKSGLVEVGDHTVHHIWMKNQPLAKDEYEVNQSKQTLEQLTGQKIDTFAYPYGAFDNQAIQVLKSDGFRVAFSTIPGNEVNQTNRFFVFRIRPGSRNGQTLLDFLQNTIYTPYK